jgi:hypothetical protein
MTPMLAQIQFWVRNNSIYRLVITIEYPIPFPDQLS